MPIDNSIIHYQKKSFVRENTGYNAGDQLTCFVLLHLCKFYMIHNHLVTVCPQVMDSLAKIAPVVLSSAMAKDLIRNSYSTGAWDLWQ